MSAITTIDFLSKGNQMCLRMESEFGMCNKIKKGFNKQVAFCFCFKKKHLSVTIVVIIVIAFSSCPGFALNFPSD